MSQLDIALRDVAARYPAELAGEHLRDVPRILYHLALAVGQKEDVPRDSDDYSSLDVCDIGGGLGMFTIGCALLGFRRSVLVDDFNDPGYHRVGLSVLDIHRQHGVEVVACDVLKEGITDLGEFDVITSFDSMEHWPNSPKALLAQVRQKLKPNGIFVLGVPNCVNLRKRITVPFGYGKWSAMADWYEEEVFRGHVREPDVDDLRYIAQDMGLEAVRIEGRNWLGYMSRNSLIKRVTPIVDPLLRLRPSLCSDIYLVGRKPTGLDAAVGGA
jgi:SAM-dependent methyltransferase